MKFITTVNTFSSIFQLSFFLLISSVIYKPGLIISTGKFYFPYQIQGIPEISWDFKCDKFYTVIAIEAIQRRTLKATTTTENVRFLGVLKKVYDNPTANNSTENITKENDYLPPEHWQYKWVLVDVEENDISSGITLQHFSPSANFQPNDTHQIIYAFAVFEQSERFELKIDDGENFPDGLLRSNFTPLSNFAHNFHGKNILIGGNFFYIVPQPATITLNDPVEKVRRLTWGRAFKQRYIPQKR